MNKTTRPVGRWDLRLALATKQASQQPAFLRIARAITEAIQQERLAPGARLPGTRTLASDLKLHRNTVIAAYQELLSEGWIEAAHGRGTFVSRALPEKKPRSFAAPRTFDRTRLGFSLSGVVPRQPPLHPPVRGRITMYGGLPDLRLVPSAALSRAYRRQLRKGPGLAYGDPRGHQALRSALASMLSATRALSVNEDDVLVTRGSQMALSLAAQVMLKPGDRVAVEGWGYRPAWEALKRAGAQLVPVAVDAHGMKIDKLQALAESEPIAAVYLTPHHQYPTTVQLAPGRRLQLLALAAQRRFAVIEDDYDHEFHYEGRPLLPLASADHAGVVVYIGTLSKVLAPGLRIGYLVAPRPLLARAADLRCYVDRQGDLTAEGAVAELLEDGELQRHVRRARRIYQTRRDLCVSALQRSFGDALSFRVPPGGMALWAKTQPGIDVDAWLERAHAHGVSFQPASYFAFDGARRGYVRLGYACLNEREIKEAVSRLDRSLRA